LTNNEKEGGGEAKNRQQQVLYLTDLPNLTAELKQLLFIYRHISLIRKESLADHAAGNKKPGKTGCQLIFGIYI